MLKLPALIKSTPINEIKLISINIQFRINEDLISLNKIERILIRKQNLIKIGDIQDA